MTTPNQTLNRARPIRKAPTTGNDIQNKMSKVFINYLYGQWLVTVNASAEDMPHSFNFINTSLHSSLFGVLSGVDAFIAKARSSLMSFSALLWSLFQPIPRQMAKTAKATIKKFFFIINYSSKDHSQIPGLCILHNLQ